MSVNIQETDRDVYPIVGIPKIPKCDNWLIDLLTKGQQVSNNVGYMLLGRTIGNGPVLKVI